MLLNFSLARLTPSELDALSAGIGEPENRSIFLERLREFLDGQGTSIAEADIAYSTAVELNSAGVIDAIPREHLAAILDINRLPKAQAFLRGLPARHRNVILQLQERREDNLQKNFEDLTRTIEDRPKTVSVKASATRARRRKRKVIGKLKLEVKAGQANPSPPVGPALGQRGINIMEFCKAFNAKTQEMEPGAPCPTIITYYDDKSFAMDIKTPPASYFLMKAARPWLGRKTRGRAKAGTVTVAQVREIAEAKMKDLNVNDVDGAVQIVLGSARSMGIEVKE